MEITKDGRAESSRRDVAEIAVGACIMAFPTAVTEEVWNLGEELSLTQASVFALASIFFLGVIVHLLHPNAGLIVNRPVFVQRLLSTYFFTLLIAALLLAGIDRLELFEAPLVGLKRSILVAFPATFAATAVDGFGSAD